MKEFILDIILGIIKMLKQIKTLGEMETVLKIVQREEIIIPSTKYNETIYISPQVSLRIFYAFWPRPSDTSPKIVEELAVGLPTEGREMLHATIVQKLARWE